MAAMVIVVVIVWVRVRVLHGATSMVARAN
jgi:hypothetical protein